MLVEKPAAGAAAAAAPTMSAFLHEAGEPIESQSTKPRCELSGFAAVPSLPAEITINMSRWVATNSSTSVESIVYIEPVAEPQLLLWILRARAA